MKFLYLISFLELVGEASESERETKSCIQVAKTSLMKGKEEMSLDMFAFDSVACV